MKLTVPDNLNGIVLIDIIKILYNDYINNYQDDEDDLNSINNIESNIKNCRYHSVNDYLRNFLEFVILPKGSSIELTRDDIDYVTVMIQVLKGSPILIDFISMMTNIDIVSWEITGTSNGPKLSIVIDRLESQQIQFVIDQFRKSLFSLLLVSEIDIKINNLISLVFVTSEAITSKPMVILNSKYDFTATSITELINGSN